MVNRSAHSYIAKAAVLGHWHSRSYWDGHSLQIADSTLVPVRAGRHGWDTIDMAPHCLVWLVAFGMLEMDI